MTNLPHAQMRWPRRWPPPQPDPTARVKALMLSTFGSGLEEQMEFESRLISARARSADGREGVDAFTAKRKPEFS